MGCKFSTVNRNFTEDHLTHEIDYDQVYTIYRNPPSAPSGDGVASAPSYVHEIPPSTQVPQNNFQYPPSTSTHFVTTSQQSHSS